MGTVAGAGLTELTELTKQPERRKKAMWVGAKSRMPEVDPSHGRDKTPEATDPEDLIPEAKTQSKESKDFSWLAQKVEERGILKKVAEGGMGEEEKDARTQGGAEIIIKFGYGKYGYVAHEAAVKSGLAPLLSYSLLVGRMWIVVMEPLEAGFKPCDELTGLTDQYKAAVAAAVRTFYKLDLVHNGDLHASNVFVKSEK
ncbi:hypothetical protein DFH08DRAFT_797531 [Mycena albidolilacea]|uniref:Protein kinase domain-containing protein n=1 Tax=Mycena albidolilacea TaxID=1033008 RepID=A0AAD7F530_9AGAR|nr:hypothetical protein DFH08DRAFT_797531 [Mycena albidolilacea]